MNAEFAEDTEDAEKRKTKSGKRKAVMGCRHRMEWKAR